MRRINPETCEKCPHRHDTRGCPAWVDRQAGLLETNLQTGEERFIEGCFWQIMPRLMMHVIAASNRPAAAMETLRNTMHRALRHAEAIEQK